MSRVFNRWKFFDWRSSHAISCFAPQRLQKEEHEEHFKPTKGREQAVPFMATEASFVFFGVRSMISVQGQQTATLSEISKLLWPTSLFSLVLMLSGLTGSPASAHKIIYFTSHQFVQISKTQADVRHCSIPRQTYSLELKRVLISLSKQNIHRSDVHYAKQKDFLPLSRSWRISLCLENTVISSVSKYRNCRKWKDSLWPALCLLWRTQCPSPCCKNSTCLRRCRCCIGKNGWTLRARLNASLSA